MTIRELLTRASTTLEEAGVAEARLQAELLLADLIGCDRGGLLVRGREELEPTAARKYEARLRRRARREPLQHITGAEEFCGLRFEVDGRVLVPRPETEGLVEAALELGLAAGAQVADLGTGSGCLAVALAVARPDLHLHALDCSRSALEVARMNAESHGVTRRISFIEGDMASPPAVWRGKMDLVISNPPYVSESEWRALEPEVRDHDPREALVAGQSGLEAYGFLLPAAAILLRPGAVLLLELGYGQAEKVSEMAVEHGFRVIRVNPDFRGIPRVLLAANDREHSG
jgi:release factor glutamine methyltransferase